jgi:hypothetical protein
LQVENNDTGDVRKIFGSIPDAEAAVLMVYYNGGEFFPLDTYLAGNGNSDYLERVAGFLEKSPFGAEYEDPVLAEHLKQAQILLDDYLNKQKQ